MYLVIRVRGTTGVIQGIASTLEMLRLNRINHAVLVEENPSYKGMLQKAKDYITWGEIDAETLTEIIAKRGRLVGGARISEEYLAENTEMKEAANEVADGIEAKFKEAMDDDFNTPVAVAELFTDFKYVNNLLKDKKVPADEKAYILNKIKTEIIRCYNIMGLFKEDVQGLIDDLKNKYINKLGIDVAEIERKIEERATAKAEKNYELADSIRSELDEKGVLLNDSKEGTSWDIKELN